MWDLSYVIRLASRARSFRAGEGAAGQAGNGSWGKVGDEASHVVCFG